MVYLTRDCLSYDADKDCQYLMNDCVFLGNFQLLVVLCWNDVLRGILLHS